MRSSHMLLCASLLLVGVVLSGGLGALSFVPFAACMLMMGVMMWMMMGSGRNDRGGR